METGGGRNQHFYEKLQLLVKARRQSVVSVVPLESSNTNRLRYLVLVSRQSRGDNNNNKLQQR